MFRSERFNLKDAIYLAIGAAVCLLLIVVLMRGGRDRAMIDELRRDLNEQRILLDQFDEDRSRTTDEGARFLDAINQALAERQSIGIQNQFSSACRCVNREGKPQRWQTAPDDALPADFSPGGTVRMVWSAEPATLMPMVARDIYAGIVHEEVFEKLVWRDLDPPFEYVPGLAKRWNVSEDGLEIVYELFSGARWSDGRPVTADDVVYTYKLVMNERFAAPIERALLREHVERCESIDEQRVRFVMKRPFFDAVGLTGGRLWILPRHVYEQYTIEQLNSMDDLCLGSGPWKLERWRRGRDLVLARNENYWGPKPAIDRLEVNFVTGDRQELDLFLAGQVDVIGPTSEQWLKFANSAALEEVGRGISYETPLRGYTWIGWNLRLPKFTDVRTRQALAMLIDRQHLIDTLLGGLGTVVNGPFHPLTEQCDRAVEPIPYDIDEAKRLLAEVGWRDEDRDGTLEKDLDGDGVADPFVINFLIPSNETDRLIQRYVKSQCAYVGIEVRLDELPWSVFQQRVMDGDFEMILQRSAGAAEVDAYEYWHSTQIEGGRNYVRFANEKADELIEQARAEMSVDARMELWRRLHRLLHDQQPQMFLWTTPRLVFINIRVQGVKPRGLRFYTSEWYIRDGATAAGAP